MPSSWACSVRFVVERQSQATDTDRYNKLGVVPRRRANVSRRDHHAMMSSILPNLVVVEHAVVGPQRDLIALYYITLHCILRGLRVARRRGFRCGDAAHSGCATRSSSPAGGRAAGIRSRLVLPRPPPRPLRSPPPRPLPRQPWWRGGQGPQDRRAWDRSARVENGVKEGWENRSLAMSTPSSLPLPLFSPLYFSLFSPREAMAS